MTSISVITVAYNSAATIADTIKSVIGQTFTHIEYIIIDGGSTDGTLDIINQYRDRISVLISEADKGIYDAMNKGIQLATGDVIGILNSDDIYFSNDVLEKVAYSFRNYDTDAVYGNVMLSKPTNMKKHMRKWIAKKRRSFVWGWHPPHPGLFLRRACYLKHGLYKTQYQVSADFELMLRLFHTHKIRSYYLNESLVNMRMGGTSTGSLKNIIKGNVNIHRAFRENKITYPWVYPIVRIFKKLIQYV